MALQSTIVRGVIVWRRYWSRGVVQNFRGLANQGRKKKLMERSG